MWGVIGIVGFAAIVSAMEVPRLWNRKRWRELAVFAVMLAGNALLMGLSAFQVPLPNPFEWIDWAIGLLGREGRR